MLDSFDLQNRFHREISVFVNTGFGPQDVFSRKERRAAQRLIDTYSNLRESGSQGDRVVDVRVDKYEDSDPHVLAMAKRLQPLREHLVAAVIHGSLGSSEVIPYSDFDGLVILRHGVLSDPALLMHVGRSLRSAQAIMIRRDPLQHHGWFVLTEYDLSCYCEAYFPLVLFAKARTISPPGGLEHTVLQRESSDEMRDFFSVLSESLGGYERRRLDNLYETKAFLSRLMLLPAAYVQARDARGIWKKDSFETAREDFAEDTWRCLQIATRIRDEWPVLRRPLFTRLGIGHGLLTRVLRKRLSPRTPHIIRMQLDDAFFVSVETLLTQMRLRLCEPSATREV